MGFDQFHAQFRARLRQLRAERGVRQGDLEDAGVSEGTIRQTELGRHLPRLDTIYRLAMALGVRPSELLDVEQLDPDLAKVARGGARAKGKPATTSARPRRGQSR